MICILFSSRSCGFQISQASLFTMLGVLTRSLCFLRIVVALLAWNFLFTGVFFKCLRYNEVCTARRCEKLFMRTGASYDLISVYFVFISVRPSNLCHFLDSTENPCMDRRQSNRVTNFASVFAPNGSANRLVFSFSSGSLDENRSVRLKPG